MKQKKRQQRIVFIGIPGEEPTWVDSCPPFPDFLWLLSAGEEFLCHFGRDLKAEHVTGMVTYRFLGISD